MILYTTKGHNMITDSIIDFSVVGQCIGTVRFENTVQFWCRSLDGDSTDVRIVTLSFPTVAVADAVADAAAHRG